MQQGPICRAHRSLRSGPALRREGRSSAAYAAGALVCAGSATPTIAARGLAPIPVSPGPAAVHTPCAARARSWGSGAMFVGPESASSAAPAAASALLRRAQGGRPADAARRGARPDPARRAAPGNAPWPAARGERAGFTRGSPSAVARCAPWMAAVARPCGPSGSSARGRCVGRTAEDVRHCPTNQRQRRLGLIRGRQCELQRGCLEQNSWPLGSCSRQHRGRHERNGPAWRRHSARKRCSASAPTKNKRTFEFVKTNTVSRY